MVQDYRDLNEFTIKNNYPLLLIGQLVDKLQGSKLFTKMDLRWGYNNVRIKEGDEWKAAFVCFRGAFEPLVICNSPATFQAMMNEIFADMDDMVVVYIDDLMIFTKTDNQAVLRLSMPNIITTDLVVFLLSLYLIRLTYDSYAVPMLPFSFHIMLHALLTPFISVQCMAMSYSFPSILPPPCGCLMHHFVSIPWPCLMHASTSCY